MLIHRRPFIWLYVICLLAFAGCASPRAPTGGDKDEQPPVLIKEESTPNQQTNFREKQIVLTFDEWFALKDVNSQLVISPLMPEQPEVKQKGKSIFISLPDSLKEETTYTINFGQSIADLNEGNVLENFAFVFSTGDVLDSVFISGNVVDAVTLKPAADVLVMLHSFQDDSAVCKIKPEYMVRTDKEGNWRLANIRFDSFRVVALLDGNLNFLYDLETEYFGWHDEILVTNVPKILVPDMYMFPKELRRSIRDVIHDIPGWLKIVVDGPKPYVMPSLVPPIDDAISAWDGDTIHYWYPPDLNYEGNAVYGADTTSVPAVKSTKTAQRKLGITNLTGKLVPYDSARFYSPIPLSWIDTSKMTLTVDSLQSVKFTIVQDKEDKRIFTLSGAWRPNAKYSLTMLPGALKNVSGEENDTIRTTIQVADQDAFGDLTLKVNGLDSAMTYLINLKTGEKNIMTDRIFQLTDTVFVYNDLVPGKYQVELIEDLNGNGFWDTGNYFLKRQPERKKIFDLESLRAAWEVDSSISW
jgi:hypothetical protein